MTPPAHPSAADRLFRLGPLTSANVMAMVNRQVMIETK